MEVAKGLDQMLYLNHGDRFLIHGLAVDIKQPVPMIPN